MSYDIPVQDQIQSVGLASAPRTGVHDTALLSVMEVETKLKAKNTTGRQVCTTVPHSTHWAPVQQ